MDHVDLKVITDIANTGWSDMCIFPTENDPPGSLPFNYTVGLTEFNHPDLIIVGLANTQAHGVMHAAIDHGSKEKGRRYGPDTFAD